MKRFATLAFMSFVVLSFMGCATKKIDWANRARNYTYDQAITELGPPDKAAKLSDGTTIAEWVTSEEPRFSFGLGAGVSSGNVGGGIGVPLGDSGQEVLRLSFGPDGVLQTANGKTNGEFLREPAGSNKSRMSK